MYTYKQELETPLVCTSFPVRHNEMVFFDIETTGFSPKNTIVYLIGCVYFEDKVPYIVQWTAENDAEEPLLIHAFFEFISRFKVIIHYNGEGFDIPYLVKKCQSYQMPYDFDQFKSIDLYKLVSPYKKQLKLTNLKQKTLEEFLDIKRKDDIGGGELIPVYLHYQKQPSKALLSSLLLHNHDDLTGLLNILPILSYHSLFHGNIKDCECQIHTYTDITGIQEQEAFFTFHCLSSVPKRISYGKEEYYLTCFENVGKLKVKVYTGELKFFFPNYKDYYYLPVEDVSIHKSVSFYVDKHFRTKAKAANCYSKKTGRFLPQLETVVTPYFKQDYHDKKTYFEATDEFLQDPDSQLEYVKHILSIL